MPPFFLILFLLVSSMLIIRVFVLMPLEVVNNFSVPTWLTLALLAFVVSWCLGE